MRVCGAFGVCCSVPEMLREFKLPAYIAIVCEVCVFFMVVSNFFATTVMDPAIYPKGVFI